MRNTGKSRKELLDELEGLRRQFADLQVSQDRLRQAEEASRGALKDSQQKQAENVALLKAVRALLEHREFKACAQAIFDSCKSIIGATAGYIALLSTDGTTTKPVFIDTGGASCAVDPSLPMPTRGMRAEAFHRGTAVYDNSFARSEHMKLVPKGHVTLDNVLFAPLMSEGKPVGLFGLANKPGGFTENDARLATWFGEIGSIALLNSHNLELLQHNEARWRSLIQAAVDAIITTDSRGKIAMWNRGAELVFGYSADEVIGKTIGLIIPGQLRKSHEEGINRVVSGGKPKIIGKTTECVGLRKDGSEFPLELTLGTWKQGAEMFFTAVVRDITQRRQAEEKSKTIIQTAMDGFWLVDSRGQFLDVNESYCRLIGYSREELLKLSVYDVEASEKPEDTTKHMRRVIEVGSDRFETRHRCKDGRILDIEVSVNYMSVGGGQLAVFLRDITERKKAEDELKLRAELLNNATDSIFVLDLNGNFAYVNETAYRLRGYAREEMLAMNVRDLDAPEFAKLVEPRFEDIFTKGESTFETAHLHKDGSVIPVETHAKLIDFGTTRMVLAIARDITERKRAEEELRKHREHLEKLVEERTAALKESELCLKTLNSLLSLFMQSSSRKEYLDAAVDLLRNWSGCRYVGIRALDEEGNIPYESSVGFSKEFLESESKLNINKHQCACTRVIDAKPESQDMPCITTAGSFWCSNTLKFSEGLTEEERARFRGVCIRSGFSTVAVVPLRYREKILGAIHLADEKEGRLSAKATELIESMAPIIGEAIRRFSAEEDIERLKRRNEMILNSAGEGIYGLDLEGKTTFVNPAAAKLVGYEPAELIGKLQHAVIHHTHPDGTPYPREKCPIYAAFRDGSVHHVDDEVFWRKEGTSFPVEYTSTPIRNERGELTGAVVVFKDITQRKRAEEELKQHYDMEGVINSLLRLSLEDVSLEEVLRKALDRVLAIPWLSFESRGAMFLVEAEPEVLVMKAQKGLAEPIQRACARIPFGRCLCGRAALTREVQFADTMDDRHETRYEGMTPHGHYCVPILSVDRVVGVLCVYTREGHRHNQREEEFMTAVANTLAGVIERKRTAKRLEKSEAMLAEAQSMAHIGSWQLDIVSNVLTWSDEVYRMFGLEPQQFRASYEAFLDNIHPDDKEMVNQAYTDSVRNRTPYSIVHRLLLKDGTIKYVEERGETLYNADGQPLRSIGIVQDITERKKAEDVLRQSEEKFAKAFRLGPEAMSIIELESGRIIDVNENYTRLIGYKLEEIIGHTVFELAIYKRFEERTATIKILKEKERYHNFEMTILTKSGEERTCLVSAELLRFGQQDFALGVYKDITERKKMEEKLLIADRLASIGQLASGIAHELNNPLTSVIGFSEMLLKRDLPDDVKEDLKIDNDQAKRTAQIVKGLLTFARKQKTEKEPVDISSLIQNVLQLRSYEHRVSNIEVNTRFAPNLPEITGNGAQLQQVFINLIVNAEQAMLEAHGRGGLIITTEQMGDMVRVSFTDDGPGISPENMRKLFSPFFTTKEVGKGTGLGLSICHGIVIEHGGRIYAESEPGKGATFVVELPVSKQ